jgi:hypothetical protein
MLVAEFMVFSHSMSCWLHCLIYYCSTVTDWLICMRSHSYRIHGRQLLLCPGTDDPLPVHLHALLVLRLPW